MRVRSASSAEALVRCTGAHLLPTHNTTDANNENGTEGHRLLCDVYNRVPRGAERCESAMPGLLLKLGAPTREIGSLSCEDAYVVDVESRTSQHLGRNINRKYEQALGRKLRPFELCVSLDLQGRKEGLWLRDFKFGITSSWWQIFVQCMAILWLPGRDIDQASEVDAGFLFIEENDGVYSVREDAATVYLVDLDDRANEMMAAFSLAERIGAEVEQGLIPIDSIPTHEGPWCNYCGSFPHCPSKWKLAKAMMSLDIVNSIDALTLDQCGEAWIKLAEIKKNIVKRTEAALKERMRHEGGFPTADGKILKVLPMPGRLGFDRERAREFLRRLGATEQEISSLLRRGEAYDQVRKVNRR